jgi:hypothetical protein
MNFDMAAVACGKTLSPAVALSCSIAGAVGAAVLLGSVEAPRAGWDHCDPRNDVRSPFLGGFLGAIDRAVIGACNIALKVLSGKMAPDAGVSIPPAYAKPFSTRSQERLP